MHLTNQRTLAIGDRMTFTPLRGNWLRCNWNGQRIKRRAAATVLNNRFLQLHPPPKIAVAATPTKSTVAKVQINASGYLECPHMYYGSTCGCWNQPSIYGGEQNCVQCRKPIIAVKPTPALKTATMDSSGYVTCPNVFAGSICNYMQYAGQPGERECFRCDQKFIVAQAKAAAATFPSLSDEFQASSFRSAEAHNEWGDVRCPNPSCRTVNMDANAGSNPKTIRCHGCSEQFTVRPYANRDPI